MTWRKRIAGNRSCQNGNHEDAARVLYAPGTVGVRKALEMLSQAVRQKRGELVPLAIIKPAIDGQIVARKLAVEAGDGLGVLLIVDVATHEYACVSTYLAEYPRPRTPDGADD